MTNLLVLVSAFSVHDGVLSGRQACKWLFSERPDSRVLHRGPGQDDKTQQRLLGVEWRKEWEGNTLVGEKKNLPKST